MKKMAQLDPIYVKKLTFINDHLLRFWPVFNQQLSRYIVLILAH